MIFALRPSGPEINPQWVHLGRGGRFRSSGLGRIRQSGNPPIRHWPAACRSPADGLFLPSSARASLQANKFVTRRGSCMAPWVGVWHPVVPRVCAANIRNATGDAGVQSHQWSGRLCVADFLLSARLVPMRAVRQTGRGEGRRRAAAEVRPLAGGSAKRDLPKMSITCQDYEFTPVTNLPLLTIRRFSVDTSRKSRSHVALT